MDYDYSPFNPVIWGVFIAAWAIIWVIGNTYRKKNHFGEDERQGK